MKLTVLGKSPSWQDADGACSGYLIEDGDDRRAARLRQRRLLEAARAPRLLDVDAVVISHLHADHFLDLVPSRYALTYAPRQQPVPVDRWPGTDNPARPRLIAPRGARRDLPPRRRRLGQRGPDRERLRARGVRARRDRRDRLAAAPLPRRAALHRDLRDRHHSPNGGGRITYGADCRPDEELVEFARDTDLLIVEATLPRPERTGVRGHLTPEEAGEHARRGRRQAGAAHPRLRRARRAWVRKRGRGGLRRPDRGRPRGRRLRGLSACRAAVAGLSSEPMTRARPVRQLRPHAPGDRRAVRRRLGARRLRRRAGPRLLAARRRLLLRRPAAGGHQGRPRRGRPRATSTSRSAAARW